MSLKAIKNLVDALANYAPIIDGLTRGWMRMKLNEPRHPQQLEGARYPSDVDVAQMNALRDAYNLPLFGWHHGFDGPSGWSLPDVKPDQWGPIEYKGPRAPRREPELSRLRHSTTGEILDESALKARLEPALPGHEEHFSMSSAENKSVLTHRFITVAIGDSGLHIARRRHVVICKTCDVLVHSGTTGPIELASRHVVEFAEAAEKKAKA